MFNLFCSGVSEFFWRLISFLASVLFFGYFQVKLGFWVWFMVEPKRSGQPNEVKIGSRV
jgi:hypothetical protein